MASRTRVGDILLKANVLDELQLRSARAFHEQWGGRLAKAAADMGFATEDRICDVIAEAMQISRVQIGGAKDLAALAKLGANFCERNAVFPMQLKDHGKTLMLAMADPSDLDTADHASGLAHCRVVAVVASETEIMSAIRRCYHGEEGHAPRPPEHPVLRADERELDLEEEPKPTDVNATAVQSHALGAVDHAGVATDPAGRAATAAHAPGDILDEILSGLPPSQGLTQQEQHRLETVRANQDKSAKIIRAVTELLAEKGYATPQELAARLKA